MIDHLALDFAPLLPPWLLAALALALAALVAAGAVRRARGTAWRALAAAVLVLVLTNPTMVVEQRRPLSDIALVVVDDSASQDLGDRTARTEAALTALAAEAAGLDGLDLRVIWAGGAQPGRPADGTRLFTAIDRALADIPARRRAGTILITDGQVHDVPPAPEAGPPVHVLLTGTPDEHDRRIEVVEAPAFGLVGRPVPVTVRVIDEAARPDERIALTLRDDANRATSYRVPVGTEITLDLPVDHAGANVAALSVPTRPGELSERNNQTVVTVNGVRDRLKVLLVSGAPHMGERAWRDLLKSDPAVDLVHFTILRPHEKQDATPIEELSLIAFPVQELFEDKLEDFDLVILDRYRRRGLLPNVYLENLRRYVEQGGAVLEAVGPDFADRSGLFFTPLGDILPVAPDGGVREAGYRPALTDAGRRHPVTADLPGDPQTWGRWFAVFEGRARSGDTLMTGLGLPLLVLDQVGKGRVAQLMSDQAWLWARGFEGGGPATELLRRVAHWLMREPELEAERLDATVQGDRLTITRTSLTDTDAPVTVTGPAGDTWQVAMTPGPDGRDQGSLTVSQAGLYHLDDGERSAVAAVGTPDPVEFADMATTAQPLAPVVEATGGATVWLAADGAPILRRVARDASRHGTTMTGPWLGLIAGDAHAVTGVERVALLPAPVALALILGPLLLGWRREGG